MEFDDADTAAQIAGAGGHRENNDANATIGNDDSNKADTAAVVAEATPDPVSFEIELYARYSSRNDSFPLSQAQADFWGGREFAFLAASGGKEWEDDPAGYAEYGVDDDVRAAFWDADAEAWKEDDPRWFGGWDSWDGFDGPSGPDRSHVFVTLNGAKPAVALNDFIAAHGCRVEVDETGASKHARHPRFTRAFMAASAEAATAHVCELEKHNSYGPVGGTLEAGEALDLSKLVFRVSRSYDRHGHVSEDIVTGVSYGHDGRFDDDSHWDCCNGEGSSGHVERGNASAAYAFAAGGALVRWWRRVLAVRALAARRRKPKSATKTGGGSGTQKEGGGNKKAPKPHGAKKADRALDPKKFSLASLMDVQIDAGTYLVDFYAGWMNEKEDWGARSWSAEQREFWSEPARRKLIEEYPESWQQYWETDVHGDMPDDDLHPFFEWGDCDTEPVVILQRTDWTPCFSQPWPGFSFPRFALPFHDRYLDVEVTFHCALGGKIVFPEGRGSPGHPGVSLDKLCEAAGEGSTRPPPQQWRIENPAPPAAAFAAAVTKTAASLTNKLLGDDLSQEEEQQEQQEEEHQEEQEQQQQQQQQQQEQQAEEPWEGPQYEVHKGWRGSHAAGTAVVVEEACSFRDFIYKLVDEAEPDYESFNCKCEDRYLVNGLEAGGGGEDDLSRLLSSLF